jgi:hypothetical protein
VRQAPPGEFVGDAAADDAVAEDEVQAARHGVAR